MHVPSVAPDLAAIMAQVQARLAAKYQAREEALAACREATRLSANAIRAVHRAEFHQARQLLDQAASRWRQAQAALRDHPDILYAGFVHDAQKEFAEASLTLAIVTSQPLPSPQDLAVEDAAYLNGLGEAAGELRRHLLDSLRGGDVAHSEGILSAMDEIYSHLITVDYPDGMTGGLRRTTDMVRGVLERTRGDLTLAALQQGLEARLAALQRRLAAAEAEEPKD